MEDVLVNPDDPYGEDFLAHFGVKGMKWGVRRVRTSVGNTRRKIKKIDDREKAARSARIKKSDAKMTKAINTVYSKTGRAAKAYAKGAKKVRAKAVSTTVGGIKKLQRAQIATAKKELAIARAAGGAVKKLQGAQIKTAKKIASTTVGGVKKLQGKQIATAKAEVKLAKSVVAAVTPVFQSAVKTLAVSNRPSTAANLKAAGRDNTIGYLGSIGQQAVGAYATGVVVGAVAKSVVTTLRIIT